MGSIERRIVDRDNCLVGAVLKAVDVRIVLRGRKDSAGIARHKLALAGDGGAIGGALHPSALILEKTEVSSEAGASQKGYDQQRHGHINLSRFLATNWMNHTLPKPNLS